MSRSVLLQLARDSIAEVLEAKITIDKQDLLSKHPLLGESIATVVNIYVGDELRGSCLNQPENSLLYNIIIGSKKAAFEDRNFSPMTTSEYLHCEIEIVLETREGVMSERDKSILKP